MKTFAALIVIVFVTFNGSVTPVTSYLRPTIVTHSGQQPREIIKRDEFRKRILNNDDGAYDDAYSGDDGDNDAYYDSKSVHFNYDYYHSEGYSTFTINDGSQFDVSDDYHYWQWWVWVIVVLFGVAALWCFSKCCLCR
jgi:hypothetical protein